MELKAILAEWILNTGIPTNVFQNEIANLPYKLPPDYLQFLSQYNGGEGWIGNNYLILWRTEELIELNSAYEVEKHGSALFLFGSNGGGESYGFDMRNSNRSIVKIPFVGMDLRHAMTVACNFTDLIFSMRNKVATNQICHRYSRQVNMELFEIKPIILGGNPIDPQNKTWLTRQQHIEAVQYWNRIIKQLQKQTHA